MDAPWHLDHVTSCLSCTLRRRSTRDGVTEPLFLLERTFPLGLCVNDTSHAKPSPIYDPPFASAGIKSKPSTESWAYFCSWLTSRAVKPVCVNVFICVFCWRAGKCRASDSHSLISISFFGGDSRACGWPGAAEKQRLSPSTSSFHRDLTPQNVPFPASVEIK